MAKTAYQVIQAARFKIHDEGETYFDNNSYILTVINDIIMEIHSQLMFIESSLVYDELSVTTTSSQGEYTLGVAHSGILRDGVWRVDYQDDPLPLVDESMKRKFNYTGTSKVVAVPEVYYLKPSSDTGGLIGFLDIPNGTYTFGVMYWKPATQLTETTSGSAEVMPFDGIFDRYITQKLVVELLEIMERDNSRASILALSEWENAFNRVYSIGIRPKMSVSNMFTVGGI